MIIVFDEKKRELKDKKLEWIGILKSTINFIKHRKLI
jgi:hypothetical protein